MYLEDQRIRSEARCFFTWVTTRSSKANSGFLVSQVLCSRWGQELGDLRPAALRGMSGGSRGLGNTCTLDSGSDAKWQPLGRAHLHLLLPAARSKQAGIGVPSRGSSVWPRSCIQHPKPPGPFLGFLLLSPPCKHWNIQGMGFQDEIW